MKQQTIQTGKHINQHENMNFKVGTFAFPAFGLKVNYFFCLQPHYEAKCVFFSLLILLYYNIYIIYIIYILYI